jgi:hypothetical protein
MPLAIREIHAASSTEALNEEWFVLENLGEKSFSTSGCAVAIGKTHGARLKTIGTLDPGFTLKPNQRVRVITGNPSKKAHGQAPTEEADLRNYHLFLGGPLLLGAGSVLAMHLKQHELVRVTFDPQAKQGIAST